MPTPSDETRLRFLTEQQRDLDVQARVESPFHAFLRIVCHDELAELAELAESTAPSTASSPVTPPGSPRATRSPAEPR